MFGFACWAVVVSARHGMQRGLLRALCCSRAPCSRLCVIRKRPRHTLGVLKSRPSLPAGDQPDWTEGGKIPNGSKKRGPDARAPDWHADPAKYAAKRERDLRERGELVVAVGPFCIPCGKRFAKQSVYDAHLSGKKHLAALQRMGRDEEAMVCQLDMEAKRRKLEAVEEVRRAAMAGGQRVDEEDPKAAAERIAAREEALRKRAMLPMPSTVIATSVYDDEEGGGGASGSGAQPRSTAGDPDAPVDHDAPTDDEADAPAGGNAPALSLMAPPVETVADPALIAAQGSGASMSYTGGMQDGERRVNRHTTPGLAAAHRALAVPAADWFNPGARNA